MSFNDVAVAGNGIPVTLTRTYDTLTANTSADFGYGWTMSFRNVQMTTSLPAAGQDNAGFGSIPPSSRAPMCG